jgi:cytochrome c oxidase subunit 3
MAHDVAPHTDAPSAPAAALPPALEPQPTIKDPTITPGKVAMWLFLGTEIMFFTGLIGTYIVLRMGSPAGGYSTIFPPASAHATDGREYVGLRIKAPGPNVEHVMELVRPVFAKHASYSDHDLEHLIHEGHAIVPGQAPADAEALASELRAAGAEVEHEPLHAFHWPEPYHPHTNPLSIDLTALNTFILICSSVTMVLSLGAIQRGDTKWMKLWLLATIGIGSVFLSIQVIEYRLLMFEHVHPLGISANGHFLPSSSLFASCFFTMTGFHGAHVAGGIILLTCVLIAALRGKFTRNRHAPIELAGLYWHFVDLVWIILFTVVYLI